MGVIRPCRMEYADRYGEIYAKAFSGEPWNDPWKTEDAVIHVSGNSLCLIHYPDGKGF